MSLAATNLQAVLINAGFATYQVGAGPLADQQAVAVVLEADRTKLRTEGRAFFGPEPEPSEAILRAGWGTEDAYKQETVDDIKKQARALHNAPWGNFSTDRSGNRKSQYVYRAIVVDEGGRELSNLMAASQAVLSAARWDGIESLLMYLDASGVSGRLDARLTAQRILKDLRAFWEKPGLSGNTGPNWVIFSAAGRENFDAFAAAIVP